MSKEDSVPENTENIVPPQNIVQELIHFFSGIPQSSEVMADCPEKRAREIISNAKVNAALASAAYAIVPGPLGLLTVVTDLITVWKIQSKMVADIAAVYGKTKDLTPVSMAFCLVKQAANLTGGTLLLKAGSGYILKKGGARFVQQLAKRIGINITQKTVGKVVSRWVPFLGSGVMAYVSAKDTEAVGERAIELFSSHIDHDDSEVEIDDTPHEDESSTIDV